MIELSYIALYRKWRPLTFSDVVEQQHVVTALRNTVMSRRIAHAYLFCGTRGTGKTTMAKIFARAINCLSPENGDPCNKCEICKGILNESLLDVVEIDAASNNKVENVRDIRDEVAYSPSSAEYKVYIIDEVHMMTTSAFNALLKTLEEPPSQIVFILATTDPHKLPATILSRCQRFDFKRISKENIANRLKYIADNSDSVLQDDAGALLARLADGALRDGVSMLDQCISVGGREITVDVVRSVTGLAGTEHLYRSVEAIESGKPVELIELINELLIEGKDLQRFSNELNAYFRDLLVCSVSDQPQKLIDPSLDLIELQGQAKRLGIARISDIIRELSQLEYQLKHTTQIRTVFESALIRMSCLLPRVDATLEERFALLEQRLDRAERAPSPAVSAPKLEPTAPVATAGTVATGSTGTPSAFTATGSTGNPSVPTATGSTATTETADSLVHAFETAPPSNSNELKPFRELQNVISQLNAQGKRMISSYLVDAEAYMLGDGVLGVFSQIGHGVLTKPENSDPIIAAIKEETGLQVRLRVFSKKEELMDEASTSVSSGNLSTSILNQKAEAPDIEEQLKRAVEGLGVPFEIK